MRDQPLFSEIDGTNALEAEAVEFLRSSLAGKGEVFVAFSGGKDSIATAELMRLSGLPYRLFYSFTGIDPPEVVRFIRREYSECVFLRPRQTFWRALSVNVPPSDMIRWCCTLLKKEAAWKLGHGHRVLGIRAEESGRRSIRGRVNHFKIKQTDHLQFYPIFHWNESQLWDFIEARGLVYPSLYDEGLERIGCVICPFHSEKSGKMHAKYRDRWPGYFERFERGIADLFAKRQAQGKAMAYDSPEEFCRAWYLDDMARWYAQEDGGAR